MLTSAAWQLRREPPVEVVSDGIGRHPEARRVALSDRMALALGMIARHLASICACMHAAGSAVNTRTVVCMRVRNGLRPTYTANGGWIAAESARRPICVCVPRRGARRDFVDFEARAAPRRKEVFSAAHMAHAMQSCGEAVGDVSRMYNAILYM